MPHAAQRVSSHIALVERGLQQSDQLEDEEESLVDEGLHLDGQLDQPLLLDQQGVSDVVEQGHMGVQNGDQGGVVEFRRGEPLIGWFEKGVEELDGGQEGGSLAEAQGGLVYQGFEDWDG